MRRLVCEMALTDTNIILRSLQTRLFSTVTTAITVAIAVALMLTLVSMRDSGRRAFDRGSGNMHLIVTRDASPLVSVLNGIFYANPPAASFSWAEYEELVSRFPLEWAIPTQLGDSYRGLPVIATTGAFFEQFAPAFDASSGTATYWSLDEGRYFEDSFEVVLGARAAGETGVKVGDEIVLAHGYQSARRFRADSDVEPHTHDEFRYRVVGILDATGTPHDRALFTDLDSSWVLHAHDRRLAVDSGISLTTVDDIIDADKQITGILLRAPTRDGTNVSAFTVTIYNALRGDTSLTVAEPSNEIRQLFAIIGDIDQILVAMAGVVMLSSGVGIMLALYNSMGQRRRQIAVLRVLGASRERVFGLVITESAFIGLLGGVAGALLGMLGTSVVAGVLRAELGLVIDPVFELRWILLVVLITVALASLAGLVPAATAYRTSVSRHLRPLV